MLYITGDTHGDFGRLSVQSWPEVKTMTRDDFIIIAGDFGGVWADTPEQKYWLNWLSEKPFTLCFVDGNHENYDMLKTYPVTSWHDGHVQFIRPNVIHLMRGQIFDIDGYKIFTMGGAASHDIADGILDPDKPDFETLYWRKRRMGQQFRVKGYSWWFEEMPSEAEYDMAKTALAKASHKVDIIISHCGPTDVVQNINPHYEPDDLTDFLQSVNDTVQFDHWYFGHYHTNKDITSKHTVLYEAVRAIPPKGDIDHA